MPREGREGSRWFNVRPEPQEFIEWFKENVPLHDGLEHERYIPGITLIPASEKEVVVTGYREDNGAPITKDIYHTVYTPYPKVETRLLYFHDYLRGDPKQVGFIEPVKPEEQNPKLPKGFFSMSVDHGSKAESFVCCTMQVVIYERETVEYQKVMVDKRTGREEFVRTGKIVEMHPPATKQVPMVGRNGVDQNSLMKAETGAIGRALGVGSYLVVPGAGIASVEDMQEIQGAVETPTVQPTLSDSPAQQSDDSPDELKSRAQGLLDQLGKDKQKLEQFQAWARERSIGTLDSLDGPALKGVIRKLEKELDKK